MYGILDPPGFPGGNSRSNIVAARDPNALTGPAGFGAANFVAADSPLPYLIEFENDATATAPAQRVDVVNQLDPRLDWDTFEFTSVGFGGRVILIPPGSRHHRTTLDLNANNQDFQLEIVLDFDTATGTVTASFRSFDPKTNLPLDVLTGFLPPEDGNGSGQGYISYTVRTGAGLPSGTALRNVARIQFDFGEIIDTNQVDPHDPAKGTDPAKEALVTLDAGAPTSTVEALPTVSGPTFTVRWSGSDDAGGAGVAIYDVLVSDNGGPFTLFRQGTADTSAPFTGQEGHTYAFFSVAADNVSHRQPTPSAAQTLTRVVLPDTTPPTSRVNALPPFSLAPFSLRWSGSDNPGGSGVTFYDVYVSDNGGAFTLLRKATTVTSMTFTGKSGHRYAFYSLATDVAGNVQPTPTTPQALTRVDTLPPSSKVSRLLAVTRTTRFTLRWSGSDNRGGAGIASYDVYVSDNGGAFRRLLKKTTKTSFTFTGKAGHRYGFSSVATDKLGNRQATPHTAQAVTAVRAAQGVPADLVFALLQVLARRDRSRPLG